MRSSDIGHSSFPAPFSDRWGRDPVRSAEEDIRRYLIRHGVLTRPASAPGNGQTALCFLGIYAAIALVALICLYCLARLECDPLFSDRGLGAACRNHAGNLARIIGPASDGYSSFMLSGLPQ
jgi:hypothetical protein